MEEKKENTTQTTFPFLQVLLKNWFYIFLATVLCALILLGYSVLYINPTHTASRSYILRTTMGGGQSTQATQANQATLAKRYFSTVDKLIKSPNALDEVNAEYVWVQKYDKFVLKEYDKYVEQTTANGGKVFTYDEWINDPLNNLLPYEDWYKNPTDEEIPLKEIKKVDAKAIDVEYEDVSLIFSVKYTDESPEKAIEKLDVLVDTFRYSNIFKEGIMATEVQLIETQQNWEVETNTVYAKFSAIGAIVGFAISFAVITLVSVFDNKIRDKKEFENLTGVSVIAYIAKEK